MGLVHAVTAIIFGGFLLLIGMAEQPAEVIDLQRKRGGREAKVRLIPCPVMSSLYSSGKLHPDMDGKISVANLYEALKSTGVSSQNALFQSVGLAGYSPSDLHQNVRDKRFGPANLMKFLEADFLKKATLEVNLFTMQPKDDCKATEGQLTEGGHPCNANVENQQHGYSTTLRDTRYPNFTKSFENWISPFLSEAHDAPTALPTKEKVLLKDGLIKLLYKARGPDGDFSSEFSQSKPAKAMTPNPAATWLGSNLKKYHPSVTEHDDMRALSVWQPLLAWGGLWAGFARQDHGTEYFTESDLRSFFILGEFPLGWTRRQWGFKENIDAMISLSQHGLGDEFISLAKDAKPNPEAFLWETQYLLAFGNTFNKLGMFKDTNFNTCKPNSTTTCTPIAEQVLLV